MIKIKPLFLISLTILSCSRNEQFSAELNDNSKMLVNSLLKCYFTSEDAIRPTKEKFFIQFNFEKKGDYIETQVYLIERDLVFGDSKPTLKAQFENLDVYVFGNSYEYFFNKLKPIDFTIELPKTKMNEFIHYDPPFLKATYMKNGKLIGKMILNKCP